MSRYTPYHLYQDRPFQEAEAARTFAYTGEIYKCAHSQRMPAFMADDNTKRQHWDAANSTCCDQPVTPFGNSPQYRSAGEYKPPHPTDCARRVPKGRCNGLEIFTTAGDPAFCADTTLPVELKVLCPYSCGHTTQILGSEAVTGQYGSWVLKQEIDQDTVLVDYTLDPATTQGHFNNCLGVTAYRDWICDNYWVEVVLSAGLNSPNGCRCDCCGVNGEFAPPSGTVSGYAPASTYENTVDLGWAKVDTACYDGSLTGLITYFDASTGAPTWTSGPAYESDGATRRIYGELGNAGTGALPACCGLSVLYTGHDGCGGVSDTTVTVARKPPSPSWDPAGDTLYTGAAAVIRLVGACNKSDLKNLSLTPTGVDTSNWGPVDYSVDGELRRDLNTVALQNTFAEKGCCGKGEIDVSVNDGCNNTGTKQYHVRNTAASGTVGSAFRCQQVAANWRVFYTTLDCAGNEGGSWTEYSPTDHASQAACNSWLGTSSNLAAACGSSTYCPAAGQCCAYYHNGQSAGNFRAAIFCVNDTDWSTAPTCCTVPYSGNGGAWLQQVSGTCCPN